MANLVITSIGYTGAQFYVENLGANWNTSNYSQMYLCTSPASSSGSPSVGSLGPRDGTNLQPTSSTGTSRTTQYGNISGLSEATTYTFYANMQTPSQGYWYPAGSWTFTTLGGTPTPSPVTNLVASAYNSTSGVATWDYGANTAYVMVAIAGNSYQTTSNSYNFYGLTAGTTYQVMVTPFNSQNVAGSGRVATFTTPSGGTPQGSLGLFASQTGDKQITANWNNVSGTSGSGTTSYEVYKRQVGGSWVGVTTTTSTSATFTVDGYGNYEVNVKSKNNYGYGVEQTTSVTSSPPSSTLPVYDSRYGTPYAYYPSSPQNNDWKINVIFNGIGTEATYYVVYFNDNVGSGDVEKWRGGYGGAQGLFADRQGHTYTIRVRACNAAGCSIGYTETTLYTRGTSKPTGWDWYSSKSSGANFNLTANEWNAFTGKINEFRTYYDATHPSSTIGQYSFTTAPFDSSRKFYGWMYNQAVTAINQMNPPTTIPSDTASSKSAGHLVYAKYFNDLRASLNSI